LYFERLVLKMRGRLPGLLTEIESKRNALNIDADLRLICTPSVPTIDHVTAMPEVCWS
jgi:hypothetical protein